MKEYAKSDLNKVKRGRNRAVYDVDRINKILDDGFIGFVSYVYHGKAITLPMSYGRKEDKIYLHGSYGNRMLLALLEAKEASMTVMHLDALVLARSALHHSVNYRSVTLFGATRRIDDHQEKEVVLECVMDQMMKGRWDELRPIHQKELERTMVVEMTIETASAKVRDVGVADEPEDHKSGIWAGLLPLKQIAYAPIPDQDLMPTVETPQHVIDYFNKNKCPIC